MYSDTFQAQFAESYVETQLNIDWFDNNLSPLLLEGVAFDVFETQFIVDHAETWFLVYALDFETHCFKHSSLLMMLKHGSWYMPSISKHTVLSGVAIFFRMITVMTSCKVPLLISFFSDYTKISDMANIVFTPTFMEQDDIECAANVLVELKQDSFNNDISAMDNCSVSPLPPLNMALVPATQDSGWRRMFENTKFELRII